MNTHGGSCDNVNPTPSDSAVPGLTQARLQELAAEYEITRELGRGGMAVVYHARERDLGREVAIKVVHQTHIDDAEAVGRLAREARLVAQLRHPNIVTLFGTRQLQDGSLALIMQYVPGRTLKGAIREDGPLPIAMVESVLSEIALALHYAHQRHGLVHRDIKPENIYLDTEGGRTLLSDFGIARTAEIESSLTLAGTALGTPAYMSPEQIDGLPLDGRSDLYSLGLVAYEMLTGQQPWAGHNLYTIIYRQKHDALPPLREIRRDVPPHMQRAIDGLLGKDRALRWSDAARFVAELRPAAAFGGIAPPAITHWPNGRSAPAAQGPDESPTIIYRPGDIAQRVAEAAPPAVDAADGEEPAAASSPPQSTPVIRFMFDSDDTAADDTAVREAESERRVAGPESPGAPVITPRRKARRLGMLISLGVFLTLGGVMVPLIRSGGNAAGVSSAAPPASTDERNDSSAAAPPPAAPPAAGAAVRLVVLTDNQTGHVGEPLLLPVGVLVEAADARAVAGATVGFTVTGGGGRVASDVAVSDARGLATTRWTLGDAPGVNELTARIEGTETAIVLRATGVAAAPARIVATNGSARTAVRGSVLSEPVVVRVEDAGGNAVAGVRVDFSIADGGGSVEPAFALTDATGLASASWTIGTGQEVNTLRASLAQSDVHVEISALGLYRLDPQPRLVAGGTHTCLLGAGADVSCWGASGNSRIVAGTGDRAGGGSQVRAAPPFARLAAGVSHTCALDRLGRAHCWGVNDDGQLGSGDRNDRPTPASVRTGESFIAITAGLAHTCALTDEGHAFCWGDDSSGQSGDDSLGGMSLPARVAGAQLFTSISAGWRHTCGLTSQGSAWCWGSNSDGQLGDGTITSRASPVRVAGSHRFVAITTGAAHTCGITTEGEAYCWGQNGSGQLGSGSNADSPRPLPVQSAVRFTSIAAGAVHSCALTPAGDAYCWGRNNFGQLGNASSTDSPNPAAVAGGFRFTYLSASGSHTCGRTGAGEFYCWGYNVEGQLGDGTRTNRSRPVPVRRAAR